MNEESTPLLDRRESPNHRNQIIATVGATLALLSTGCAVGFSGIALPAFIDLDSEIQASQDDLSWIASMVTVGCIVGNFIGGFISDLIGRKKSILVTSLVSLAGWVSIASARGLPAIFLGRAFTGLATGLYSAPVQVYICEVVDPSIRGVAGSAPSLTVAIGILSAFSLGSLLDWRILAWTCGLCPLLVLLYVFLLLPESPVWLMSKGRVIEASKAHAWFNHIQSNDQSKVKLIPENPKKVENVSSFRHFFKRSVLRPLFVGSMIFFFQQFVGVFPILSYSALIFRYSGQFASEYLSTIFVGIIRLIFTILAIFLVKFLKPKTLLIVSGFFMFLSNGILGGYFYAERMRDGGNSTFIQTSQVVGQEAGTGTGFEWIPLVCLLVFMGAFCTGYGVVPWFLMPEIVEEAGVRSLCCSIAFTFGQVCRVVTVKTFLDLVDLIGADGTFWTFSGVAFVSMFFVAAFVPDLNPKGIRKY